MGRAFLGADEGQDFGFWVNGDSKSFFVPSGDRFAEGLGAVEEEVAVGGRVGEGLGDRVENVWTGGQVRGS